MVDSRGEELSPVKRALLELRELRTQLDELEGQAHEPIAVIGVGLRFPGGANDLDSYWQLLRDGVDAIAEVPPDRWDINTYYDPDTSKPGKMTTRFGGFVNKIDHFDPQFFGISPREAVSMDPQQRLLLEVTWEALENAGQSPDKLFGTPSGVFLGISNSDYLRLMMRDLNQIDTYSTTGSALSVAGGRLSYVLGLQGPNVSVDTACSSSLVAIHLAVRSLRLRESHLALAGGVNVILTPDVNINFSKAQMMAADGRCKTFDSRADGYVRGEGCGMVVLKRLSDALADGDRILAVIRGTAINQDGRSGGLTAPNGPSQENVITAALADAGLQPSDVSYIEAHGTGTSLGDPIEVQALGAALGKDRQQPLMIGSVKTNFGHLEAAAGVAGFIKAVLALQHGEIPPHLNFIEPNPYIPWAQLPVTVPTALTPWQTLNSKRIAGVSSFGFSGTNSHVILEEAPAVEPKAEAVERPAHILALSSKNSAGLTELAQRYQSYLSAHPGIDFGDVAYTANTGRAHFPYRLAVAAETSEQAREKFAAFAAGESPIGVSVGQAQGQGAPEVTFLFTGHGSQYLNMGQELYQTQPTFRHAIDECDEQLRAYMDCSLLSVLFPEPGMEHLMEGMAYTQPALFAIQYALAALWRSWGIEPTMVMGHSVGEYAAACVAGVFSLDDGLKLVAARGRLMESLPETGQMVAVFADEATVAAAVAPYADRVSVAVINGPTNIVISGAVEAVEAVLEDLQQHKVKTRKLAVAQASHSPLIDPMLDEFERVAATVHYAAPRIELVSCTTGQIAAPDEVTNAAYWRRHVRQPVRFSTAIETLHAQGQRVFVEIGPHPTLLALGQRCLPDADALWIPSLREGVADWTQMLESVGTLYVNGVPLAWDGFDRDYTHQKLELPTYPFQRARYWSESAQITLAPATPVWESLAAAAHQQSTQGPLDLGLPTYIAKWDVLDRLTTAHIVQTLHDLGAYSTPGESYTIADFLARFQVQPVYEKLIGRWLKTLAGLGYLGQQGEQFVSSQPLPAANLKELWQEAQTTLADLPFMLTYLERCGSRLTAILTGAESPLETLFPGGSFALAEDLYQNWSLSRYYAGIMRSVVEALVRSLPSTRPLRIIEVGAGTGATTYALLPVLPPERTSYTFTDVSDLFLAHASQKFKAYPFVRYGMLDLEQSPEAQGYAPHSFDLVVATNVLHATRDLNQTLQHVQSLLAPGGLLLLDEGTEYLPWFDMTTGLIGGWQRFEDGLRSDNPLLKSEQWDAVLRANGFGAVGGWPEAGAAAEILGQHILLAQTMQQDYAEYQAVFGQLEKVFAEDGQPQENPAAEFVRQLEAALPDERHDLLVDYVRQRVARVLRLEDAGALDRFQRLLDMGLDSLMALELRTLLSGGLDLHEALPATLVFDYPTIDTIATYLEQTVLGIDAHEQETVVEATPAETSTARAAEIAELSDEEVEAMLLKKLRR